MWYPFPMADGEEDRRKRAAARSSWPVQKFALGAEPEDDLSALTPSERVALVWRLTQDAWASAGQMNTRFEIARAIGANGAVLFRTEADAPLEQPAFPPLAESPAVRAVLPGLGSDTRAIEGARTHERRGAEFG